MWEFYLSTSRLRVSVLVVLWALFAVPAAKAVVRGSAFAVPLLVLATLLPLAGAVLCNRVLVLRFKRKNRALQEDITQMQRVEQLAGIGRWCIDLVTGRHRWSEEICTIVGIPPGSAPDDDLLSELMEDGLKQMEATFQTHQNDREPFVVEFEVEHPQDGTRILRARASNTFSPEGEREQVFMVVRDVTDEYARVASAERDRAEALAREEEAQRLANTDALTGLGNRRAAMVALDRAIMAARQSGDALGLILFDIDHFKRVNDTHGHAVGDRVLAEVGRITSRNARSGQFPARVGGEEFMLIMTGVPEPAVAGAAERLRLAIEAGTSMAPVPGVTVSIGRAMLAQGDTSLTLFARADAALYAAKRGGRNRVALAA